MPRRQVKSDEARVWEMLRHADELALIAHGRSEEDIRRDPVLRRACERLIEIIGEASRHVSGDYRAKHPEIPWRAIEAQRHVLAHEYGEIDLTRIWRVVCEHVPELSRRLREILPPPPSDPLPEQDS